jgi:hypothetical protein
MAPMNRRTLDVVVPMVYGGAVVATVLLASGRAVTAVAAIGAVVVAIYYAGVRRNITR